MFTDVFNGGTIQAAQASYRAIALATSIALAWPAQSVSATDFAARMMDVTPSAPSLAVTMPPANAVAAGYDVLFTNKGAQAFTVKDNAGNVIATVNAGAAVYLYITVNTTAAGSWASIAFGATTSAPDAASLVGLGLAASAARLQVSLATASISAPRTIASSDRAQVYVWTGGVGTITLPAAASLGADFFFEVRNQGTGVLTLATTAELIDSSASIALQVGESAWVHSGGSGAWYTVGRGRNQSFAFTLLSKAVTGGTVNLTMTEAANVVQNYTGVLTSNCNVVLPSVVQVYYVRNNTTGAFSLTFKTAGVGTTITIAQGQAAVLFCDGLNVVNSATSVGGITALTLSQGAVGSPSINYSGDTTTGLYQPASGQVAIASAGVQVFLATGTGINNTAIGVTTPAAGTFTNLGFTGQMPAPLGAVGAPSYSFLGDLNTGIWSPGADKLAGSVGGAEIWRTTSTGFGIGMPNDMSNALSVAGNITIGNPTRNQVVSEGFEHKTTGDPSDNNRAAIYFNTVAGGASSDGTISFVTSKYGVSRAVRAFIDGAGNFGIGTTSPGTALDVNGTITVRANIFGFNTASAWSIASDSTLSAGVQMYGSASANPNLLTLVTQNAVRVMVSANGRFSLNAVEGPAKLNVTLGTGFSPGNAWDTSTAIFGNGTGVGGGNFGIAYDDTSGATLMSIWPGSAWKNMRLCAQDIIFAPQNVDAAKIDSTGKFTYGANEVGFRRLPAASVATGAFAAADSGKCVYATAGVTIPNATMVAGDVVVIQNTTGGAITITKTITTAYNTNTGAALGATFTLGARGRCSIIFESGTVCDVSGNIS